MRALIFFLSFAVASSAHAALEFSGYIQTSDGMLFVITDRDTGTTSDHLKLGAMFRDYQLAAFDAKSETLTLDRAGTVVRLPLKASRIQDAKMEPEKKYEVHIAVSAEGNYAIDGQPITLEAFTDRLRQLGTAGDRIDLFFHYEPTPDKRSLEALNKLAVAFKEAGLKKFSIRLVRAQAK